MRSSSRFKSFKEFWPFYLSEHGKPLTKDLHFVGLSFAIPLGLSALILSPWFFLAALLFGYGFAWISHFRVEKNRPATFKYPLWSLRGDLRMYRLMWIKILAGKSRHRL